MPLSERPNSLENSGNPPTYPASGSFTELLNWHLNFGTRPDGEPDRPGKRWGNQEFAAVAGVSTDRAVRNWRRGTSFPRDFGQLEAALFGSKVAYVKQRAELRAAYDAIAIRGQPSELQQPSMAAIPPAPPHFLGRDEDVIVLLNALLSREPVQAIVVRGGPGIGKTSLTRAVGNHEAIVERFGGTNRWFVELDTAPTAASMEDAIARAIGCDPAKGFNAALRELAQRPGLVVLDNLETPWDPLGERLKTEACIAALTAIPGVAVLASFRGGRQSFRTVKWTLVHHLERLHPPFDRELFQQTAGSLFDGDLHFDDLLAALDGIPLAIELVALRAHGRPSLGLLWEQWQRLGVELASDPDYAVSPDRLTSLPHSIELSLRSSRMTSAAMRLFRFLGQLPAGLSDDDRDLLLGANSDGFAAADALLRIGLATERASRLDLLSPIREHARRRYRPELADQSTWPSHYLNLAKELGEKVAYADGAGALARLMPEFANIESAFRACIEQNRHDDIQASMTGFIRTAYISATTSSVLHDMANYFNRLKFTLLEARCIEGIADINVATSNFEAARKNYLYCIDVYRHIECKIHYADCLARMAYIDLESSDLSGARARFTAAYDIYLTNDSRNFIVGRARCAEGLGDILLAEKEYTGACNKYVESFRFYNKVDHLQGKANCISSFAKINFSLLRYRSSLRLYNRALNIYDISGDKHGQADCYAGIGEISFIEENYKYAADCFQKAGYLYKEEGIIEKFSEYIIKSTNIVLNTKKQTSKHKNLKKTI